MAGAPPSLGPSCPPSNKSSATDPRTKSRSTPRTARRTPFAVVLNKLFVKQHLRAAVPVSAGGSWAGTPMATLWAVIDCWLDRRAWRHRKEVATDAVGLEPLLVMLRGAGDRIAAALRTDASLTAF